MEPVVLRTDDRSILLAGEGGGLAEEVGVAEVA